MKRLCECESSPSSFCLVFSLLAVLIVTLESGVYYAALNFTFFENCLDGYSARDVWTTKDMKAKCEAMIRSQFSSSLRIFLLIIFVFCLLLQLVVSLELILS